MVQQIPIVPPLSTLISVAQRRKGKGREKNSPSHIHNKLPTGFLVKRIWQFLASRSKENCWKIVPAKNVGKNTVPPPMNRHNRCCFVGSSFFSGFWWFPLSLTMGRKWKGSLSNWVPIFSIPLSLLSPFTVSIFSSSAGGGAGGFKSSTKSIFTSFFFSPCVFLWGKRGYQSWSKKERNGNRNGKKYPLSEVGSPNRCV